MRRTIWMECCLFRRQNRKKMTTTIFMRQSSEFLCKFFKVIIFVLMSNMKWASSHNSKMVRRKWNYQLLSIGSNLCRFQYFQNIYAKHKNKLVDTFEWGFKKIPTWVGQLCVKSMTIRAWKCIVKMEVVCCL